MPTLHILCGPPGSGKTTLSKQLTEQYNAKLYCFDDIPGAFSVTKHQQLRRQMHKDIVTALLTNEHVVCDDVNTRLDTRQNILSELSDIECTKIIYFMTTPLEECLKRNRQRDRTLPDGLVEVIYNKVQPPTQEEGWDFIVYC